MMRQKTGNWILSYVSGVRDVVDNAQTLISDIVHEIDQLSDRRPEAVWGILHKQPHARLLCYRQKHVKTFREPAKGLWNCRRDHWTPRPWRDHNVGNTPIDCKLKDILNMVCAFAPHIGSRAGEVDIVATSI